MKRLLAFLALVGLVLVSSAGYFPTGRGNTPTQSVSSLNGVTNNPFHPFSDAQYLERQAFQPSGGLAILLRGSHQTYYSNAVALLDSIRNGAFPNSTWTGVDIHLGIAVDPESTKAARAGTHMTIAEVRAIAANPSYEIVLTSSPNDRLGGKGVNTTRPSYGGVTGLSGTYVNTLVTGFQTWARDTALIACPVSWSWRQDRYMAGSEGLLRQVGIYQAFGRSRNVNALRANHDSTETYPEDGYNYAQFIPALFGAGGHDRWVGHHIIGEQIPDYNLGGRVWDRTGTTGNDPATTDPASTDSLRAWVDMGIHKQGMGLFIVDGQVGDSTSVNDMKYAHWRTFIFHAAHRVNEAETRVGWFESLTPRELAARKRGIRTGQLFPHNNFAVLCPDINYTNGAIISTLRPNVAGGGSAGLNRVPVGFSTCTQHYGSGSSADTFATPGTAAATAGSSKPTVEHLATVGDSIALSFSVTDSSYGMASATGNVIMSGMHDNSRGRPVYFPIIVSGCEAASIRIAVQFMVHSTVTFSADSLYMSYKFFQFKERWDDHMNEGPSSYQLSSVFVSHAGGVALPDTTLLRNTTNAAGTLDTLLIRKERMSPQFAMALIVADTTAATGIQTKMYNPVAADSVSWYEHLMAISTSELVPSMINSDRAEDYDFRNTLGNYKSLKRPAVNTAGSAHERFEQDMTLVTASKRVYTMTATVPINRQTDYVFGMVCLENLAGTLSAAGVQSILDISVTAGTY